ncbi:MAG: hypothetical protein K9G61_07175 [Bacteroidales bacterium]|nr:hypothetical protein [Bacteroidales bacterium]
MKSFYSLIKIIPNEMSGDSLTIGILLAGPNGFRVKFSKHKKQLVKSMLLTDASNLDFIEREIGNKVKEQNRIFVENKKTLFVGIPSLLSSDYFSYLSRYSNGLLKFSPPAFIADNIDDDKFTKLFSLFVDSSAVTLNADDSAKQIERVFYEQVNTKLISRVKDVIHVDQNFDNKVVPSLFTPFKMDCIGLNGVFVGAKSLPFTQTKETLHKTVNTYISVIAHLSSKYSRSLTGNKFFLIADQPDKKTDEYKLWKQLRSAENLLTVISSERSGEVADLVENKGARTFLDIG